MPYILDPMYYPDPGGGIISETIPWAQYINPATKGRWVGHADMVQALDQNIVLGLTCPVGTWTNLYYGLLAQLNNWEWNMKKVDESIEVSPLYKGFYDMVMNEKQNIEIKIKKVVDDIITHSSDLELLEHDFRRYREFYGYFGFEQGKKPDEHSLKALFIDMVDFHSGEPSAGGGAGRLSMSFMQQQNIFPTVIQDFYQITDENDLEKNERLKNLPTVEKDMLRTKWRAYAEWKSLFGPEVKKRYEKLRQLIESKRSLIEKSKDWLKPFIARHKLLKEGMSIDSGKPLMLLEWTPAVQPTSMTSIKIWAWKEFPASEIHKISGEFFESEIRPDLKFIEPYVKRDGSTKITEYRLADKWTMNNLILNEDVGLKNKFKFINENWVHKKVDEIYAKDDWFRAKKRVRRSYMYYAFLEITFDIFTCRSASGLEIEDIGIGVRSFWMSRNVLLTKLLELKAMQDEFESEINMMLGIRSKELEEKQETKPEKSKNPVLGTLNDYWNSFTGFFSLDIDFSKLFRRRPYEMNFKSRVTKFYLTPLGRYYFGPVVKYLRAEIMK